MCLLVIGKNTFLLPTGDRSDLLDISRGERNAWEEERQDILWIIYEEYKWAFCSFKLRVELRAKNSLRDFASSSTDLLLLCSELHIHILYGIYIGIIIYNTEVSLMNGVCETRKCWDGLNIVINKVDS